MPPPAEPELIQVSAILFSPEEGQSIDVPILLYLI